LYGALPSCGIGELAAAAEVPVLDGMWHHCERNNAELLASLKEDVQNARALQQIAQDDFALGRMTRPRPASEVDLASVWR
jgi:type II secretory pathway component HofQ